MIQLKRSDSSKI